MSKIFFILKSVCVLILIMNVISATDILVWQGQYYTGTTFNVGTYAFNFSVYDNLTGGNICYSNSSSLTTGSFGEWRIEQEGVNVVCNNVSKDYFLNININGIDQTPRRRLMVWDFLRKNVNEVSTGNLIVQGVIQSLSPLKLQDEINFVKADGTVTSALYNAPRELSSNLSSVFTDSLIHDIIEETNAYGMQECFWDENTQTMQMCISGAYLSGRATTISRSLQIVGNTTSKAVNEDFNLCEGNLFADCNTDITGADLLVQDDIEAIGSIFSQENITADYLIGDGSLLTNLPTGGLSPVYLQENLNATNAGYTTVFTISLTPNKMNIIRGFFVQSSPTAGVAIQNRIISNESGLIGYCNFHTQTADATEVIKNIVISTTSADTAVTSMSLDANIPFINTFVCTALADSNPRSLIVQFDSETIANVTTYAGSYYTKAVN